MRALLLTVGTGKGVEEAIANSIVRYQPEVLLLLVSATSRATLTRVSAFLAEQLSSPTWAQCCLSGEGCALLEVTDIEAEQVDVCYRKLLQEMRRLESTSHVSWPDSVTDFTSGTKAMSAAAVLAAQRLECGTLIYQGGKTQQAAMARDVETGRVKPGQGETRATAITFLTWERLQTDIKHLFNLGQFAACREHIAHGRQLFPEAEDNLAWLDTFVLGYAQWDLFNHRQAMQFISQAKLLKPKFWSEAQHYARNAAALTKLAGIPIPADDRDINWLKKEHILLLADLYANAERRAVEGKFDDAVARLYRLTELVAQFYLMKTYQQAANQLSCQFLIDRGLQPTSYYLGKQRNGAISVGLRQSYHLLADLGDTNLSDIFFIHDTEKLLDRRNFSILAHGFTTVTPDVYYGLVARVRALCEEIDPDFAHHVEQCTFPAFD